MKYYVYLIQSLIDGSYYIGQTSDINGRLIKHNGGKVFSTKKKKPWKLVKTEEYNDRSSAMWREHLLKTRKSERERFIY